MLKITFFKKQNHFFPSLVFSAIMIKKIDFKYIIILVTVIGRIAQEIEKIAHYPYNIIITPTIPLKLVRYRKFLILIELLFVNSCPVSKVN